MKPLLTILFLLAVCGLMAQKKLSWQLVAESNASIAVKKADEDVNVFMLSDVDAGTGTVIKATYNRFTTWEARVRPGLSAGLRLQYPISARVTATGGALFSRYAASRERTTIYTYVKAERIPWPSSIPTVPLEKSVKASVSTIDIPLGISWKPGRQSFSVEAEAIPMIVVATEFDAEVDPEIVGAVLQNRTKAAVAAGVGAAYRFNKSLQLALRYRRSFGNLINAGLNHQPGAAVSKIDIHTLGLQLRWTLPGKK